MGRPHNLQFRCLKTAPPERQGKDARKHIESSFIPIGCAQGYVVNNNETTIKTDTIKIVNIYLLPETWTRPRRWWRGSSCSTSMSFYALQKLSGTVKLVLSLLSLHLPYAKTCREEKDGIDLLEGRVPVGSK